MNKLKLNRETIRNLNDDNLKLVQGGGLGTRMCGVYIETETWQTQYSDDPLRAKYIKISLETFCAAGTCP